MSGSGDGASEEQLAARQRARIEVNHAAGRVADGFPASDRGEWAFRCECGAADCEQVVSLPLYLYEDLVSGGGFVLAEGHVLQRAEGARAWVRELRRFRPGVRLGPHPPT